MSLKNELIECFKDTIKLINEDEELLERTKSALRNTMLYEIKPEIWDIQPFTDVAEIKVTEKSSLNAARECVEKGYNTAVLNFASATNPGGGVTIGALAQEESLCRCSNLVPCLKQKHFMRLFYMPHRIENDNVYTNRVIFSKDITIFKSDDDLPKPLPQNEWFETDIITCAAPNYVRGLNIDSYELSIVFKSRIRSILSAAIRQNCEAVVLGAFGCGAFGNPPEIVAEAFRSVLIDENYSVYFKYIEFAIKKSENNNFSVFSNVFNALSENIEKADEPEEDTEPKEDINVDDESGQGSFESAEQKTVKETVGKFCPYCGAELHIGDKFCFKCGKKLLLPDSELFVICTSCNGMNTDKAQFCQHCGKAIPIEQDNEPTKEYDGNIAYSCKTKTEESADKDPVLSETIGERYKIIRQIGKGASSIVYLAQDIKLERVCAVKIVRKNGYANQVASQLLLEEVNKMKVLAHISIPQLYDVFNEEERLCIVMEYIEGSNLGEIMKNASEPLDESTVINWSKQICQVLYYLHTLNPPRIFRDIKPANIILQPNGIIKLIDFGIMRNFDSSKSEDTANLGTKGYAAPEQFGGRGQTDERTDIYGLGMTMHHLLTCVNPSNPPYEVQSIRSLRPELSPELERIILKCTEIERQNRYQSCADLLDDLDRI